LLAIHPPDAAASRKIFYCISFALLHFSTDECVAASVVWFPFVAYIQAYHSLTTGVV
jgi:hypothetical protein